MAHAAYTVAPDRSGNITRVGAGAIVDFLRSRGFRWLSVRAFLLKEIEKRGLPPVHT
jgi:hypothetical protein